MKNSKADVSAKYRRRGAWLSAALKPRGQNAADTPLNRYEGFMELEDRVSLKSYPIRNRGAKDHRFMEKAVITMLRWTLTNLLAHRMLTNLSNQ
jgi:hypothetical protein